MNLMDKIDYLDWQYFIDSNFIKLWIEKNSGDKEINARTPTLLPFLYQEILEFEKADELFNQIDFEALDSLEKMKYHFVKCNMLMRQSKREAAFSELFEIKSLNCDDSRKTDILERTYLREGVLYAEMGDIFKAAMFFSNPNHYRKNSPHIQKFKLNEVIVLTDLGQVEALKMKMPEFDPSLQEYFSLYYECSRGSLEIARKWIQYGLPPSIPIHLFQNIIDTLIQAVLVLGSPEDLELIQNSWIVSKFKKQLEENGELSTAKDNLALIGLWEQDHFCQEFSESWMWRNKIKYYFRQVLFYLSRDTERAMSILKNELKDICTKHRMMNPHYPYVLDDQWFPDSAWSEKLKSKLRMKRAIPQLYVENKVLKVSYNNHQYEISMPKSPKTNKVLKYVADNRCLTLQKQNVHEILSESEYMGRAHDSRVYKILSRINEKMEGIGLPEIFEFDGEKINVNYKV